MNKKEIVAMLKERIETNWIIYGAFEGDKNSQDRYMARILELEWVLSEIKGGGVINHEKYDIGR